ncbi:MAG: gamma-glutamyltransferase [Pseudomonadales bacterium]|nr:gamma-glutamyltransferase [Pseudomonadales bacterium]
MSNTIIVTPQPESAEAGARVLRAGGNAVDAAMTAALVQGVVDPQMTGIAGFGNCQIYMRQQGVHQCIDFHGKTPLSATPDMWQDRLIEETRDGFGFVLEGNVNDLGYQSVTTPGSLMAYAEAVSKFGTCDWKDVVAPAIRYADEGFVIRPQIYTWWTSGAILGRVDVLDRLGLTVSGRDLYFRSDGSLKRVGERITNKDMATTLKRIAQHGHDIFYTGEIAEEISSDMSANGGLLSAADLAAYRTTWNDPLQSSYRGLDLATNQPPGGGVMLVEMLNILEHFDLRNLEHNSTDYIRTVCEAMKAATADKEAHVGDPAFVDVPMGRLTDKQYAGDLAARIQAGERMTVERFKAPEPPDTTHVAVMDSAGNCVTMTHSLGMPSGVITDGLGFMYNGCMGVFDPRPNRAGSIAPGKSRFSSLCPTIVFAAGEPRVVIGAPGGTQIAMGVLQSLLNIIDFDMTVQEAVAAPRFSATSAIIDVTNRIPDYTLEPLREAGYEIARSPFSYGIAGVHGVESVDGRLRGGADPGLDGVALGVTQPRSS